MTAAQFEDAEGRALVEAIHQRKNRNTMNGETTAPEDRPVEWSVWPPPQTSRSHRRDCARNKHHGLIKAGYCALCGTKVTK